MAIERERMKKGEAMNGEAMNGGGGGEGWGVSEIVWWIKEKNCNVYGSAIKA